MFVTPVALRIKVSVSIEFSAFIYYNKAALYCRRKGKTILIGEKLRNIRKNQDISIKELAEKVGLTSSLISQIERDLTTPSISTLIKLTDALGIPMAYLFDETVGPSPVVRKNERRQVTFGGKTGHFYELLSGEIGNKKMSVKFNEWDPGCGNEMVSHQGEECGIVLEGTMEVTLGMDKHLLEEGDSIYFDSTIPHEIKNIGEGQLKTIWINTPPSL